VVGSNATNRARGSSIVVASCSVVVADMTEQQHAEGQIPDDEVPA